MSKLPKEVVIKLEEMKGPIEIWSVQLLRKNLQAHLTARQNAKIQRRTYLPQNVASTNKFTTSSEGPLTIYWDNQVGKIQLEFSTFLWPVHRIFKRFKAHTSYHNFFQDP